MLESLQKLQNVSDSSKYEKIARVLDEDHDGVVDKAVVMEVIVPFCAVFFLFALHVFSVLLFHVGLQLLWQFYILKS